MQPGAMAIVLGQGTTRDQSQPTVTPPANTNILTGCLQTWNRWDVAYVQILMEVGDPSHVAAVSVKHTLYPPPVPNSPFDKEPTCGQASLPQHRLLPKDVDLIAALKQVKLGTSPGPFADSTLLLCSFALMAEHLNEPDKEAVYPNLATC